MDVKNTKNYNDIMQVYVELEYMSSKIKKEYITDIVINKKKISKKQLIEEVSQLVNEMYEKYIDYLITLQLDMIYQGIKENEVERMSADEKKTLGINEKVLHKILENYSNQYYEQIMEMKKYNTYGIVENILIATNKQINNYNKKQIDKSLGLA